MFHSTLVLAAAAALRGSNQTAPATNHHPSHRVSVPAIFKHLEAFSAAADSHHGSRAVTTGYNASAEYVIEQLEKVDFYEVRREFYTAPIYEENAPPSLEIHGMEPSLNLDRCEQRTGWQHYYVGCDYAGVRYGGSGKYDVTADVVFVEDSCTAEAWSDFKAGDIALLETTSDCDYYTRGMLAQEHKAGAVIFKSPLGSNTFPGSRVYDAATWPHPLVTTPCIGVTHAIGQLLKQGNKATVKTDTTVEVVDTYNVIAESRNGNPNEAVMMGSHLDSVPEGPGLNDNGSGSASTLEIALEWAKGQKALSSPEDQPRVRFGWWGAEEIGLIGSRYHVDQLMADPAELKKLQCYLNYDMEAGPNYIRMVHDASTAPVASTIPASTILQEMYETAWREDGLSFALTGMTGGSDFLPFNLAGIPTGGLATGASGRKTEDERDKHGGLALAQLDPCYHAPCDTLANIDRNCLRETSRVSAIVLSRLVHDIGRKGSKGGKAFVAGAKADVAARQRQYAAFKNDPKVKRRFNDDCNENSEEEEQEELAPAAAGKKGGRSRTAAQ